MKQRDVDEAKGNGDEKRIREANTLLEMEKLKVNREREAGASLNDNVPMPLRNNKNNNVGKCLPWGKSIASMHALKTKLGEKPEEKSSAWKHP